MQNTSRIISVLVRNQPGVLMRVAGMFSRRGFNIDSLAVGITQVTELSRITITMCTDDGTLDQVKKQLAKLVEVEKVRVLPKESSVARNLALFKVSSGEHRLEILKLADVFRANVIDVSGSILIMEITGSEDKLNAFYDVLEPYGILEMVQTGMVALQRGEQVMRVEKSKLDWPKSDDDEIRDVCMVI